MFLHYLKISIRNILRDKVYSVINITGLAVAIACCLLLIFWVRFELSYENTYTNTDRIYKVLRVEDRPTGKHHTDYYDNLYGEMKQHFPEISAAISVSNWEMALWYENNDPLMVNLFCTSIDFLKMFSYTYTEGSLDAVVKENGCIISEEAAKRFFGNESPIGKTLNGYVPYQIKAVARVPENTQLKFDVLNLNGIERGGQHYIMFHKNVHPDKAIWDKIANLLIDVKGEDAKLLLQPLDRVHLYSPPEIITNARWGVYGSIQQVWFFSLAAALILLVAIINYVNTSITRSLNRMKEVGVRKITGAGKSQLMERFLFESFIVTVIAVFIGLSFAKYAFPYFSEMMGNQMTLVFDLPVILIAIAVCLFVSLLSGGYAAFYLATFSPSDVFRGGRKTSSKEGLRKVLIGVQFFLAIAVLTCTYILYKQINTLFTADTGVDKENMIILDTNLWYQAEDFFQVIKKENPHIIDATIASDPPYNAKWGYSDVSWTGSTEEVKNIGFYQIACDCHYASTFGLQLVQGEFLPPGMTWWQYSDDKSFDIVINESFRDLMGVENPLGMKVKYSSGEGKIIGVVKDFNFKPLKERISPLILCFNPESSTFVYIKTTGQDKQATLNYILNKYKEMKPDWANRPVIYRTIQDEYNAIYKVELQTAKILTVFSIVTFFLSLIGVISMISFMVETRTKEIGIRKINGATAWDIILLFIKEILQVAVVASVVAIPVSYLLMNNWLQSYVFRTPLSWWIFVLIPIGMILFTNLIIAIQVYMTARQNPVDSLRNE